ncbi:MAG: hypothetical protein J1D77_03510 [Muribaculaceae bacterium]|nr:hypothetical protein [Muribaculaceae bacterium]
MTFKELYQKEKEKPRAEAPGVAFIKEVCEVTKKSEPSVRRWLCEGATNCLPDALTQEVLARHFGTTANELFPR